MKANYLQILSAESLETNVLCVLFQLLFECLLNNSADPDKPSRLLSRKLRQVEEIWICDKGWKGTVSQKRNRWMLLKFRGQRGGSEVFRGRSSIQAGTRRDNSRRNRSVQLDSSWGSYKKQFILFGRWGMGKGLWSVIVKSKGFKHICY